MASGENGFAYDRFASSGRYIESDPIGLGGGINTYAYTGSNPISRTDSSGLAWNCTTNGFITTCTNTPPLVDPYDGPLTNPRPGWSWPDWLRDLISPAANSSDDAGSKSGTDQASKACPAKPGNQDPCKGLRKQLEAHQKKLQDYIANPSSMDNLGMLANAYNSGNMELYQKIISARIASLMAQIENFRKQLEECEKANGK